MRHSVGSARDKDSGSACCRFQLASLSRCSKPRVVGSVPNEKPESDSPESQSDGCERSALGSTCKKKRRKNSVAVRRHLALLAAGIILPAESDAFLIEG